jgi:hypothetical protein
MTRVIVMERNMGKTTLLTNELAANPKAVMLVIHEHEKKRLNELYPFSKGRIFTIQEAREGKLLGRGFNVCLVDNADLILESVIPNMTISMMSVTGSVF